MMRNNVTTAAELPTHPTGQIHGRATTVVRDVVHAATLIR